MMKKGPLPLRGVPGELRGEGGDSPARLKKGGAARFMESTGNAIAGMCGGNNEGCPNPDQRMATAVAAPKKKMESGYLHRDVLKPLADSPQTARADTARGVGNFERVGF